MTFHDSTEQIEIKLDLKRGKWLQETLGKINPSEKRLMSFAALKASYEAEFSDFEEFWNSEEIEFLRELGLLTL